MAATEALALPTRVLPATDRLKLIERFHPHAERLREEARPREEPRRPAPLPDQVTGNLIDCLAKLSENRAATTSKDWGDVGEGGKEARQGRRRAAGQAVIFNVPVAPAR